MRHNLWIGLSYSLSLVLILTFLTKPSFPGYVAIAMTPANFHFDLLWFGSTSKARSSTWTFSLVQNHLFPGNKFGAKNLIQYFQNSLTRACVLLKRCLGFILSSGSGWGGWRCWPIRISVGVVGGVSQMSLELGYKGRPLMMYVVSDRNDLHCSSIKAWFLHVALRLFLTDLMRVSTTPFWWLAWAPVLGSFPFSKGQRRTWSGQGRTSNFHSSTPNGGK